MGYMRHHGIMLTTFDRHYAGIAHAKAVEIFGDLVSEIRESAINGYHSFALFCFAVFPDGSKEGWPDSDEGDSNRARFKAFLEARRYKDGGSRYDWVEVQYGDDDNETCIVADSDEQKRRKRPVVVESEVSDGKED